MLSREHKTVRKERISQNSDAEIMT